ncbi:MAG TPA: hypothetical protein EYG98_02825 [Sulfurovum sp.]|nr:hypothetical protein [Sulfurovum sp.]
MKKFIYGVAALATFLLFITACGEDVSSKVSFEKKIDILASFGFDVNKTKADNENSSYILTIKDSKMATISLLSMANMATLDPEMQQMVAIAINGAKVGIDVDWTKYTKSSEGSVLVYFMGTGRDNTAIETLIAAKKIGAYLTFDAKETLVKVRFNDIDEKISKGTEIVHIYLKGAEIDVKKAATKESPSREFTIKGGEFRYEIEQNGSKELVVSYTNPVCNVVKSNDYLGKQSCSFPAIQIDGKGVSQSISILFKDSSFSYDTTVHNKKLKSDILFQIPNINIKGKDRNNSFVTNLKDLKMSGFSDNVDEEIIKALYELASKPSVDTNKTLEESMKLVGEMFSNGIVFDYKVSLALLDGTHVSNSDSMQFAMQGYQGEGKASFDKTINYKVKSTVESINVNKKSTGVPIFAMQNFRFGYEIKDMYNFLPTFMEFATIINKAVDQENPITKEAEEKMSSMGMRIVNDGFGLSLSPIGVDSVSIDKEGKETKYGQLDFNINAKLGKNSVKLDNPMSAMALLAFLQADGRLVLSKADLDQMSNQFPPPLMAMVMMYAKYEGDKVIFVLKFENGHLKVNDKPVM